MSLIVLARLDDPIESAEASAWALEPRIGSTEFKDGRLVFCTWVPGAGAEKMSSEDWV